MPEKRWMVYFEERLNRLAPRDPMNTQPACHDLPIICTVVTNEESRKAIIGGLQLKWKCSDFYQIPTEALKVDI